MIQILIHDIVMAIILQGPGTRSRAYFVKANTDLIMRMALIRYPATVVVVILRTHMVIPMVEYPY